MLSTGKRGEIGGVIKPQIHLSQAAKLSRKPGPPQYFVSHTKISTSRCIAIRRYLKPICAFAKFRTVSGPFDGVMGLDGRFHSPLPKRIIEKARLRCGQSRNLFPCKAEAIILGNPGALASMCFMLCPFNNGADPLSMVNQINEHDLSFRAVTILR